MENDFHAALYQAKLLYDINISEEDFEELGLIAWNYIGNKKYLLYEYSGVIDKNLTLTLPCNVNIVESVTRSGEDWSTTSNQYNNGDIKTLYIENFIESRKNNSNPLYNSGGYVTFRQSDNVLYFNKNYGRVNVLYKGLILDENGLPKINDKEVLAIATFVAYRQKFKESFSNPKLLQMVQILKAEWDKTCDLARIPEQITLNDMNLILDTKTSWDRKIYNKSYKPIK